ncbi:MAG: mechanosensitive ion channel family protein, partial [Candidatus Binatia bacterium]
HSAAPDAEAEHVDLLSTQFAAQIGSMRIYVQAHRPGIVLAVLLLLALAVAMYWARARSATDVAGGTPLPESVARIYRAPLATALIFAVVCTRPLRPDPPLAIQQITLLILLWGTLVLLRPLLDRRLAPTLYALAAILVVDIGRQRLLATPAAEQVVLLLETSAASVLLLLGAGQLRTAEGPLVRELPWLRAAGSALLRLAALATMAAAIAAALGYLNLADLVGSGSLFVVFISIGLLSVRVAVAGVIGLALLKSPLARLHTVQRGGARIERAIGRALDLALVAFWILMTLQVFEVQAPVAAALQSALGASLYIGDLNVPIGRIFNFAAVVVGAWIISRVVVFALEEDVYPRLQLPRGVPYALSSLIRYGLLLLGFFLALGTVGLDLTKVTILVSAFGLGIGFGLQQIVNNFVSGLILLFERPVQVGDSVQLADLIGEVTRIGIRSSTIRTLEGAEVVVPNSSVLEEKVTNWTLSDRKRRVDLSVGVTYGTDAARMIALLVDVARGIPAVVDDPPPEAFFIGFGDSSLDFQIRVWTVQPKWARLRSDLAVAVQRALADAGIEVPFPQRDLHIRSDRSGPPPPGQDKP